jgi:hypothetical protein
MDRDLRRLFIGGVICIWLNLACAGLNFHERHFALAFTSLAWTVCCSWALAHIRSTQETRDQIRVVLALRNRVEEEAEYD